MCVCVCVCVCVSLSIILFPFASPSSPSLHFHIRVYQEFIYLRSKAARETVRRGHLGESPFPPFPTASPGSHRCILHTHTHTHRHNLSRHTDQGGKKEARERLKRALLTRPCFFRGGGLINTRPASAGGGRGAHAGSRDTQSAGRPAREGKGGA